MAFERVLIPLGVVVLLAGLILLLAWLFQRRLIYFPSAGEPSPVESALPLGDAVTFVTDDGLTLAGWFLPASRQSPLERGRARRRHPD